MKATFFEVQTYDEGLPESMGFLFTHSKREAMTAWKERYQESPGSQSLTQITITAKTVQDIAILAAYLGSLGGEFSIKHAVDFKIERTLLAED